MRIRLTVAALALVATAGCTADAPVTPAVTSPFTAPVVPSFTSRSAPPPTPTQGTGPKDPETGYAVPDPLRRPVVRPALGPGGSCPADRPHPITPELGPGPGPGPAYPVGLNPDGTLAIRPPGTGDFIGPYGGQKVLWAVDLGRYRGPVLIRGLRLDAPGEVRFGHGAEPVDAIQLPPVAATDVGTWLDWPSYTRLRTPGCYAYQVDGASFSYRVVFRAIGS